MLLDALRRDRALWATACYAGLRLGELWRSFWTGTCCANEAFASAQGGMSPLACFPVHFPPRSSRG
jgi:hypothetical protein